MTVCLHRTQQSKTAKPRVGPCKGLCAPPARRIASVHLRGAERRCWGLCAPLLGKTVLPLRWQEQHRRNRWEAGQCAQPPTAFSNPNSTLFCLIRFRQAPRARAMQRVRKYSRIKARRRKRLRAGHSGPQCGPLLGLSRAGQGFRELFGRFDGCLLLASLSSRKNTSGV